jgi:hypothetical protein
MFKDPALVKKDHDLSAQMTARKEKLSWLIGFINDNGVLVKVRGTIFCDKIDAYILLDVAEVPTETRN